MVHDVRTIVTSSQLPDAGAEESAVESRAKFLGHALHQQLVLLPVGLLLGAVGCDLVARFADRPNLARTAATLLVVGVIAGAVAAVVGLIDWAALPGGTRAKRVATRHGVGNLIVLALFAAAWGWRERPTEPSTAPLVLEVIAAIGLLITGWLGGELVGRLAVGVDRGAHLDAPNSLSGRRASESETLPASRRRSFF